MLADICDIIAILNEHQFSLYAQNGELELNSLLMYNDILILNTEFLMEIL